MELTVLGRWAPYPRAGGACSGYLLKDNEVSILIDCGNGSFSNLLKHIDFRNLDAVFISHFHPDHYMDLFCLRHAVEGSIRDGSRKQTLPLYVPETPEKVFSELQHYDKAFQIHKITPGTNVYLKDLEIKFIKTGHALEAYGMLVQGSSLFGYTADTSYLPEMETFFQGCDLLLSEASVMEKDKEYAKTGHLTVKQASELGKQSGAKQLILTHFWPEYNLGHILQEAEPVLADVQLAEENLVYEF